VCLQFLGFAEKDFAEAGWALSAGCFFGVGALLFRTDERSVFVIVNFADYRGNVLETHVSCAGGSATMAVVLRGYLQAVNENTGAAGVDAVGG
jgi:hypothetical protein